MSMLVVFRSLVADAAVTGNIVTLGAPFSFATAWTDDSCVDGGTSALSVWTSAAFALSGPSRAEVTTVIRSKPLRMAPRRSGLIVVLEKWLNATFCSLSVRLHCTQQSALAGQQMLETDA